MAGSGEIQRREDGKWSFLVRTSSGEAVATDMGEGYPAKAAARAVLEQLLRGDFDGPILEEPGLMCGQEITEDTTLEDDLVCTSGPGLIVAADNITLDLGGHTISGTPGTPGILLRNVTGVTVQNGTVQGFGAGVVLSEGSRNTIRNLTAQDNIGSVSGELGDGINVLNSSDNLIQGNNVLRNGPYSGISLVEKCQGNMVRGNIVADNNMLHTGNPTDGRQDMGIRMEGPEANNNQVIDNTVTGSGAEGISLHATCTNVDATPQCVGSPPNENNEVARNTCNGNGSSGQGSGIKLFSTPNAVAPARNSITDNVTDNNATNGISVDSGGPNVGATENTIARNKAHGNGRYDASDGNTATPCDANVWKDNDFGTVNQPCVRGSQTQPPPAPPGTIMLSAAEPSTGAGALFRIDPATATATMISSAGDFATPVGVAVEADGGILVVDADAFGGAGGVIRVDPLTGTQTTVSAGGLFSNPFDLVVEADGAILVVDPHASRAGGVIRVDPDTGEQVMVSSGQETGSATALREVGIALETDGAILVVEQSLAGGRPGNGRVTRIDPTSGDRTVVSEGGAFSSPAGVVVEANGGILVADTDAFGGSGGVIRVDPVTGAQTTVSSGGTFVSPIGVALEPNGGVLVADADAFGGSGGVIRLDPVTGGQTTVSAGGTFRGPRALATVPAPVPPPTPPGEEATIGPVDLRVDVQGAQATVHVTYDINFSVRDLQTNQVYSEECRLMGDDTDVGDPAAAGADDTLGFLTPLFNDHTAPEGGRPTLSRHFMKTIRKGDLDEDRGAIPNPDEIRARVTLTPRATVTRDPIRRESNLVTLSL